jgi:hypothetical protein
VKNLKQTTCFAMFATAEAGQRYQFLQMVDIAKQGLSLASQVEAVQSAKQGTSDQVVQMLRLQTQALHIGSRLHAALAADAIPDWLLQGVGDREEVEEGGGDSGCDCSACRDQDRDDVDSDDDDEGDTWRVDQRVVPQKTMAAYKRG